MCTQKAPYNWADDLYKRYQQMYDIQLERTVLPAIKARHGEAMLHEFAKRWKNHKLLVRQMWKLFVYLVCATPSLFVILSRASMCVDCLPSQLLSFFYIFRLGSVLHQARQCFTVESRWYGRSNLYFKSLIIYL